MTYVRRLAAFLYDFFVGEAPELFFGPIVILAIAWLALVAGVAVWLVAVGFVVGVVAVATVSVMAGLRQAR